MCGVSKWHTFPTKSVSPLSYILFSFLIHTDCYYGYVFVVFGFMIITIYSDSYIGSSL